MLATRLFAGLPTLPSFRAGWWMRHRRRSRTVAARGGHGANRRANEGVEPPIQVTTGEEHSHVMAIVAYALRHTECGGHAGPRRRSRQTPRHPYVSPMCQARLNEGPRAPSGLLQGRWPRRGSSAPCRSVAVYRLVVSAKRGLHLRTISWVASWSVARLAAYGLGAACEQVGDLEFLESAYREWPLFATFTINVRCPSPKPTRIGEDVLMLATATTWACRRPTRCS